MVTPFIQTPNNLDLEISFQMTNPATSLNPSQPLSSEQWRPAIHFTPQKNWINDPNGLVYFEGEYHLFYQYNPYGMTWGHMSWGHAVSSDLLHWEELDVAIPEREFMAFSGCALVDWKNKSGLGDGINPPLLAFYTAYHDDTKIQAQHLAYSHDKGRTWQEYIGNPIIDLNLMDFRDPCVFWHPESERWVMAIALSKDHKVQVYNSTDLKKWTLVGEFGPFGNTQGQWECPALFKVDIEGEDGNAWVLKIDVDNNMIGGGSGSQYFMGEFNGKTFVPQISNDNVTAFTTDFGGDFYAAITWNDLPAEHTAPVWIGWFSNHQTGKSFPTFPWRGSMTLPRELFGFRENGELRLGQRPISNLEKLRSDIFSSKLISLSDGERFELPLSYSNDAFDINMKMEALDKAVASIVFRDHEDLEVAVGLDRISEQVFVDRTQSNSSFDPKFAAKHEAPVLKSRSTQLQIIYDKSSIEVFVDGGRRVISDKIFPAGLKAVELRVYGGSCEFQNVEIAKLSL